jgi:hypothetical protein
MRAKEFIIEADKLRRSAEAAIPDAHFYPALDNSSPYASYRYGIALAGSPDHPMDKNGPTQSKMITLAYTDADAAIINKANKTMGVKGKALTGKHSQESSTVDTNNSPVARPKRNKYGV